MFKRKSMSNENKSIHDFGFNLICEYYSDLEQITGIDLFPAFMVTTFKAFELEGINNTAVLNHFIILGQDMG